MNHPLLERNGDAFVWTWLDAPEPVRITFDYFREGSDGLKCEVRVETAFPVDEDGNHGLYHWATFNLSSTSARATLAKTLHTRTDKNPWPLMLEAACARTAMVWREGEPVIDLSEEPEVERVEYLIDGVLPLNETTLFSADGESRKSWLAVAVGLSVLTGQPIGGLRPCRRCNVLFLDYETGKAEVRRREGWIARGLGLTSIPRMHYRNQLRTIADDAARIRYEIKRHNVGLVIVDSLGPATGDDLEKSAPAIQVMNALRSLPVTRLALAHVSKTSAEQKNGRGRTFGSVFFENLARSVWEVRGDEHPTEPRIGLFHRKVNAGKRSDPIGLQLSFDDQRRSLRIQSTSIADTPEIAQYASLRVRINSCLRDGAKSTKELSEMLDTSENVVRNTLSRMENVRQLLEAKPGRNGSPAVWGLKEYDPF